STTILSIISSAGGFFGVMTVAYSFLYGTSSLNPWGLIHKFVSVNEIFAIKCDKIDNDCEKGQCICIGKKLSEFESFETFIGNYLNIPKYKKHINK
ncbi:269_t:CDS:2, partial [Cetraspora pellucida]